jgi:hypothetical protein
MVLYVYSNGTASFHQALVVEHSATSIAKRASHMKQPLEHGANVNFNVGVNGP